MGTLKRNQVSKANQERNLFLLSENAEKETNTNQFFGN